MRVDAPIESAAEVRNRGTEIIGLVF